MSEEGSIHSNDGLDGSERQHISDDDVFDDALDERHSQSDAEMDFEEGEQTEQTNEKYRKTTLLQPKNIGCNKDGDTT
ncbi:unnamed protein product [Toxocara canis]|uniref:CTNNB1_binding domain-containing protein n=1 Tax=Toxocara canis TaxID=6265 RepID=A0A183UNZ7_TOXCA|nr:unnamed protein product [Toxocara canis]